MHFQLSDSISFNQGENWIKCDTVPSEIIYAMTIPNVEQINKE